ncbi:hypothetical protein DRO02_00965 [archaeon]|nr:MAG: hypothetical protein DRO02_00965 [archaeon]RLG66638.1 MAG: hypothetical protein DRN89_00470 [archaeon]
MVYLMLRRATIIVLTTAFLIVILAMTPTKASQDGASIWPMFRHDLRHTGVADRPSVKTPINKMTFYKSLSFNRPILSSPAIFDVDKDGLNEIIVGGNDDLLKVISCNGSLEIAYPLGDDIRSSPAVADVDLDGYPEIIVGCDDASIYLLETEEMEIYRFSTNDVVLASPMVADVDLDGVPEIIVASLDGFLYILNYSETARIQLEYKLYLGSGIESTPAIHDIDLDGTPEIICCTTGGDVYCISLKNASPVKWSIYLAEAISASPAIWDLNDDGYSEIIVATHGSKVYVLNYDGSIEASIQLSLPGQWIESSPAIFDVDGDGIDEIIVGCNDGYIYCIYFWTSVDTSNLSVEWKFKTNDKVKSSPAICDFELDDLPEIVAASMDGFLYILDCNGSLLKKFNLGYSIESSPSIGDLDMDGMNDIVCPSANGEVYIIESDISPPTISKIRVCPDPPTYDERTTIYCSVEDDRSGVASVTLKYTVNDETWNQVEMQLENGAYKAQLPLMPWNTTVTYKITAVDMAGNTISSETLNFTIADLNSPDIVKVEWSPSNPEYYESVTVKVLAREPENASGLKDAWINVYYMDENETIPLNNLGNGTFLGGIHMIPYKAERVSFIVKVMDNAGNIAVSESFEYEIVDTVPPEISYVRHDPEEPEFTHPVIIVANVTEPYYASGVKIVYVTYFDGDKWNNASMTLTEIPGIYKAMIPPLKWNVSVQYFVTAIDNAGNKAVSKMMGYKVCDRTPPIIEEIKYSPENPSMDQEITVRVKVSDQVNGSGIYKVILKYFDGVNWREVEMIKEGGNVYVGKVPPRMGAKISFYISVIDRAGNRASSSIITVETRVPLFNIVPMLIVLAILIAIILVEVYVRRKFKAVKKGNEKV